MTTDAKYNFDENILKLSKSNNLNEAKREWYVILKETRTYNERVEIKKILILPPTLSKNQRFFDNEPSLVCICQHKIRNIIYMYNKNTQKIIIVGTKCCKKFNLYQNKLNNDILEKILINIFTKGDYEKINNIIEYSDEIKNELIKYLRNKLNNNLNYYDLLFKLKKETEELIEEYGLIYLKEILYEILDKIKKIGNNNISRIHIIEKNKIELLDLQIDYYEKINNNQQLKNNYDIIKTNSMCNIKRVFTCSKCNITNECNCKLPLDKLYKITNTYICLECNKCNKCNNII